MPSFPGYSTIFVQSGTAALALLLIAARLNRPQVESPSVVLPAYGCPDLVTAAQFAGLRVVLADIHSDDPSFDLSSLGRLLNDQTVAVVAVNFLGLRDRLAKIRDLLFDFPNVTLVEDNAQQFPEPGVARLEGDGVCTSFGRGKPVSLLGGGAAFVRELLLTKEVLHHVRPARQGGGNLCTKVHLYNQLLRPTLFGLVNRLPFLKLGRTEFKQLSHIEALDADRLAILPANVKRYLERDRSIEKFFRESIPSDMNLPMMSDRSAGRLLRYPVLCATKKERDVLLHQLTSKGLGASAMYRSAIPQIPGIPRVEGEWRGAEEFADRLLTLPLHSGVSIPAAERIRDVIRRLR